jgi:RNA polymerase sigma-70 factor (ECF subfamily)
MFNICLRITGNHAEAEDVLQEAFIKAFRNIDSFEFRSSFGAWLKRIVINTTVNHMNKQKALMINLEEDRMQFSDLPDTDYQSIELEVDNVKKAINKLPNGYRIVLSLYLLEGYDHKEIAKVLGISESTSKTQYIRAKKKLRELLTEEVYHA